MKQTAVPVFDAVIIGGGPAGAAIAKLLASWGYFVLIINKASHGLRGLAESLPPSTKKILAAVGALDVVEAAPFYRTTGNTVWWASQTERVETFGTSREQRGYQVFRPALDQVLLQSAAAAGAVVREGCVQRVRFLDDRPAQVEYDAGVTRATVSCRFVIDCSGRAGIVARRYRERPDARRECAVIGAWQQDGWDVPDVTHTLVETYEQGWAWSVPISSSLRQVGVIVHSPLRRVTPERTLFAWYRAEVSRTCQMARVLRGAELQRVWACDASLYTSRVFAGPQFLLVGDAASFIDPLSSFGVKKALTSAWVGATVVNTCLSDRRRQASALQFFADRERRVYTSSRHRARDFAASAYAHHQHSFWTSRASDIDESPVDVDEASLISDPHVQTAFQMLKERPRIDLVFAGAAVLRKTPAIRGREIVLEDAVVLRRAQAHMRFLRGVDLVRLADLASRHHQIPDLFDTYCRILGPVSLPNFLGSLSLLVANGVLTPRNGCDISAADTAGSALTA